MGWPKGKPRNAKPKEEGGAPAAPEPVQSAAPPAPAQPAAEAPKVEAKPLLKNAPEMKKTPIPMKNRPNWDENTLLDIGADQTDRLNIAQEIVQNIFADGFALQWGTREVRGQPAPKEENKFARNGWTPVSNMDFGGVLDGMFANKGSDHDIVVDDCVLMARPIGLNEKAKLLDRRRAGIPVQTTEQAIGHGIPGVTGSDHPSAIAKNSIKKTFERIAEGE